MTNSIEIFGTIDQALAFRTDCPYCITPLAFEPIIGSFRHQSLYKENSELILIDNSNDINITANLTAKTLEVKSMLGAFGTYFTGLKFICPNQDYQYNIKVVLDTVGKTLKELSMNSERCVWSADDVEYTLSISYPFNEIAFHSSKCGMFQKIMKLPIVKLDITNTAEMLKTMQAYATFL